MRKSGFAAVAIILIVVIVLAVAGGIWYYEAYMKDTDSTAVPITTSAQPASQSSTATLIPISTSLAPITPVIMTSTNPFGVFPSSSEADTGLTNEYIDDGIVPSGTYAGYHLFAVWGGVWSGIPGVPDPGYIVATKNFNTFLLDSNTDPNATSDLLFFDQSKVTGVAPVSNFPAVITKGDFALAADTMLIPPSLPTGSIPLASNLSGLNFFSDPFSDWELGGFSYLAYQSDPVIIAAAHDYFSSTADILVQDQHGITIDYTFFPREESTTYIAYNVLNQTTSAVFYNNTDFTGATSTFNTYGQLTPDRCGNIDNTAVLKNISQDDLVQIATTTGGVALYALNDKNHPLYEAMYRDKVTQWQSTAGFSFESLNNGASPPTYQEYVAENPILIFQDPWGRWIGVGELDYQMPENC